jgi:cytochrome c oxidase subunit 3
MTTSQFHSAAFEGHSPEQRREAALLGMWAFLATELMFFGPLFFGYVHARISDPQGFVSGSHHMHIVLGTLNTAILLTSSFTMALGVHAAQTSRPARAWLIFTAVLGAIFVGIKAYEWSTEFSEAARAAGGEARFYFLYFAMTGLHAIHLTIGVCAVSWLAVRAKRFGAAYHAPVEVTGLYWHFVDIVWVFLYPMFYLLERYR